MILFYFCLLLFGFCDSSIGEKTPENNELSPFGECFDGYSPTFIRHIGTRQIDGPAFVAKVDMVTCSTHCRANFDPSSEEVFPCEGFNFRAGRNPVCEFFPATGANKNATKLLKIEETPTFFYEKVCLRTAKRCEESAYMFDVKKGYRIDHLPKSIINVTNEMECMEECTKIQCLSFGYHKNAKRCSFYDTTRRDSSIQKDPAMNYYENNCIHPSSRCPNGRIEFFVTRKADVPSFGLSLGVKSIRSCMQACVNANQFYCRSIQFDSTSNECFVSDETSDVAVPSATLDIYEPFCVPNNDENTCNRPYSFEKMITSRLTNAKVVQEISNYSIGKCLQKCIGLDSCQSVNFNVLTRSCHILSNSRTIVATTVSDENFDFYELTCPRIPSSSSSSSSMIHPTSRPFSPALPTVPISLESNYVLIERSQNLLPSYRTANYSDVENVQDCWKLCIKMKPKANSSCEIISFSSVHNQCCLSSYKISNSANIRSILQPSDSFDIYTSSISKPLSNIPTTTVPKPTISLSTSMSTSTFTPKTETISSTKDELEMNNIFEFNQDFIDTTASSKKPNRVRAHALPNAETKPKNEDQKSESLSLLPIDPELVGLEDTTPQLMPVSSGIAYVQPTLLNVNADCLEKGINITFDLPSDTKYTGVVYASERFDQCRVFIRNASIFSIFIPRPKHNSWCNAVEINNEMSTIVIMSNDRILPHDVTTKDDLFYQISCEYTSDQNQFESTKKVSKGMVVGGPSPVLISKKNREKVEKKISLEISKDGKLVESVFVGESLMATVKSNVSAENLRVVDCTAHRVGGTGPPASVNLIADGCALLPAIMSPMHLTSAGWQSSLSAFRIDGSEQIDVVCILSMCEPGTDCPLMSCPPQNDRSVRSTSEENSIRIDRRLMVKGDRSYVEKHQLFAPICIEPSLYLPGIGLFFCSLISIAISIFLTLRRTRRRDAQVEQLLNTTLPQEIGPKYIKTVSMGME